VRYFTHYALGDLINHRRALSGSPLQAESWHAPAQGKDESMSDSIVELETEIAVFETEVSDEALEIAGVGHENAYTLGGCTGLSVCPE
jgi:hypothetical protein